MSLFRTLAAGARAAHHSFFGRTDTVYLTAFPGDAPQPVPAVLGRETVETRREDNRDVRYLVRECRFAALNDGEAGADTGIVNIRHDAIVTIDNVQYSIDHVDDRQASGLTVKLQRMAVIDSNRPNYRGKG